MSDVEESIVDVFGDIFSEDFLRYIEDSSVVNTEDPRIYKYDLYGDSIHYYDRSILQMI